MRLTQARFREVRQHSSKDFYCIPDQREPQKACSGWLAFERGRNSLLKNELKNQCRFGNPRLVSYGTEALSQLGRRVPCPEFGGELVINRTLADAPDKACLQDVCLNHRPVAHDQVSLQAPFFLGAFTALLTLVATVLRFCKRSP